MGYCSVKQLKDALSHIPNDLGIEVKGNIQIIGSDDCTSDELCGWINLGDFLSLSPSAETKFSNDYKHLEL